MMSFEEQMIVIALCGIVTLFTRFLPFKVFGKDDSVPSWVDYLGRALPAALFAMLVVYCLKDVDFTRGTYGIPELLSIVFIAIIHMKWRNILGSLIGGVAFYLIVSYLFTMI